MSGSFRVLDNVAVADVAFEAVGDSPSELFVAAGQAVMDVLADPSTVADTWHQTIDQEDEHLADLLFEWLSEMVYVKDAQGVVFSSVTARVDYDSARRCWRIHGTFVGEQIDPARHALRSDVKAVTKHLYELDEAKGRWKATVVLDI